MADEVQTGTIRTKIPARLDRLPWSHWHWMIIIGLGTVWILDGLEVTLVGNIAGRLSEPDSGLTISAAQVTGLAAALYVAGACSGALIFGYLTDRFGRKKLFMITLAVYLGATALTAISFNALWFFVFRFLTGFGIGGEYSAINSAIDELIPSKHRGRVDLMINGSYWLGAAGGALLSIPALNESLLPANVGWRLTFAIGVVLGLIILVVRRHVPESPRWQLIHGQERAAEATVDEAERIVAEETGERPAEPRRSMTIRQRQTIGFITIAKTVIRLYPKRGVLGFALFVGQAFIYNAITFGFATILITFFHVPSGATGYYYVVIAIGNFLGPLLLGPLFDTVGRKPMITSTYVGSGVLLLLVTAWLFDQGVFNAWTLTVAWTVVLFFASAGASSAYLTVSEVFPMETRALAIAFFYAIGTAAGGITGPLVFADLVGSGSVGQTALAFVIGAILMIVCGLVEVPFGVKAEGQGLENIAKPLTVQEAEATG